MTTFASRSTSRFLARAAALLTVLALACISQVARADAVSFATILSPDSVVPPAGGSNASGQGIFVFEDEGNTLTWTLFFADLAGPASAASISVQPAGTEPGTDVGAPLLDLFDPADGATQVIALDGGTGGVLGGNATLDALQVESLFDQLLYVEIGTDVGAELRGQLLPGGVATIPLPAAAWLFLSGLGLLALRRRVRA